MEGLRNPDAFEPLLSNNIQKEISQEVSDILMGETKITFDFVDYNTPEGKEELKQVKRAQKECLTWKNVDRNELNKFRCKR